MSLLVDIEKDYGGFRLRARFETSGGITGLLGASGCGKSQTLRCIAGLQRPDRGRILLDGRVLFDSERRIDLPAQQRSVGYLFQSGALFPHMTVRNNILAGLHAVKDTAEKQRALRSALELLALEGLEDRLPGQLSGGQAQRAALARILVSRPRALLLDEPFSAVDSHLREQLQLDLLDLLRTFAGDVILVTHSRDEAYHMCSRIALMDAGCILTAGPVKQVFANPGSSLGARLTGCKNVAAARKAGPRAVLVPDWGVTLQTAAPVGDGAAAVGIRAHALRPDEPRNRMAVAFVGQVEEPFAWIVQVRTPGQRPGTPALWWRMAKGEKPPHMPEALGVAPEDVLVFDS